MAGIYLHIPFCKQACHYCDFHFSTVLKQKANYLAALHTEIRLQKEYLGKQTIDTIYFGGGTPSLLLPEELEGIFAALHAHFNISSDAEITLEANPDDLLKEKISFLKSSPVNRLSIGIQSFRKEDLTWMNRAHTVQQASDSIKFAQDQGIGNISIDLIYGLPELDGEAWRGNLHRAFELDVQHISAYCLTVEPRTALAGFIKSGKTAVPGEDVSSGHFRILREEMQWNGFKHYEISNFGKPEYFSKHNSNYWKGVHYLGLGPSAHSFNGISRQWNVANTPLYIRNLLKSEMTFEQETLTPEQRYNEYVMTSLRTMWGTDLMYIRETFGVDAETHCTTESEFYLHSGKLIRMGHALVLTEEGMLIADRIASDLFMTGLSNA